MKMGVKKSYISMKMLKWSVMGVILMIATAERKMPQAYNRIKKYFVEIYLGLEKNLKSKKAQKN